MPVNTKIQFRRGLASEWTSQVLSAGEVGYETDTGLFKIGDGVTQWSSLRYASTPPRSGVANSIPGFAAGSGLSLSIDGTTVTYSLSDPTVQLSDIIDLSGVARTFLLTPTSLNLASLVTDETGSGKLVFADGPTMSGVTVNGNLTVGNNLVVNGVTLDSTELARIDGITPGSGIAGKALVLDNNLNITNVGNITTTGTVTVGGNLVVNGQTTTVNSTITTLDDPIITLGGDTAPTGTDSKDRGVEFRYFSGSAKTGFFGWDNTTGQFKFLTDATNTSESFTGTTGTLAAYINWNNVVSRSSPVVSVNLTGDVTGSGNATLTNLDSAANITLSTTIPANSVVLGVDTTGQYASTITTSGSGITITPAGATNGTAYTISSNASASSGNGTLVLRDGTGSFSAGNITGNSFVKSGGTSSQFLKADGSVDSSTYATTSSIGNGTLTLSVSGSGLTGSASFTANQSSGTTFTVNSNASASTGVGTLVLRDASGGFAAGAISATSFAGDGSSLTSLNASQLTTGTVSNSRLNIASTSGVGIAAFSSANFAVDNTGLVTVKTGGISNSNLVNSSLTIGSSSISLGGTGTAITGLVSLAATNLFGGGANITNLNASNINAGTIGVSYLPTGIPVANLASTTMTFGSTVVTLGSGTQILAGLAAISGTSAGSPTTLTFCVIDGGTP